MKKKHIPVITLASVTVIAVVAIALGTVLLLRKIDGNKQSAPVKTVNKERGIDSKEPPIDNTFGTPKIDTDLNKDAEKIEQEAVSLLNSSPEAAQKKYLEAAKAYKKAGNISKASEMQADAMTAELLVKEQSKQQN